MKFFSILYAAAAMLLCASLTACSNDAAVSQSFSGTQEESTLESSSSSDTSFSSAQGQIAPKTTYDLLVEMVQSGEITYFKMGDEYHLVNKYVEATFEEPGFYLWGVVDDNGEYVYPLIQKSDFEQLYGYADLSSQSNMGNIYNLNENMFLIGYYGSQTDQVLFYNAQEDSSFVLTVNNRVNSNIYQRIDGDDILEGFHDGLLVCEMHCGVGYHDKEYRPILIEKNGNLIEPDIVFDGVSKIFRTDGTNSVGPYREGMFWAYGSFYDRNCSRVIDLTDYQVKNIPCFEGGQAELQIQQNGKLWSVSVDSAGEFLGDPIEIGEA